MKNIAYRLTKQNELPFKIVLYSDIYKYFCNILGMLISI